jgi:hypothetical protein
MARFLLLLTEVDHYQRWADADERGRQEAFDAYNRFIEAVASRGRILAGQALAPPELARTVTAGSALPPTAGPFAETVEQIGGFYLVEVPDLDAACDLARLLPSGYCIEVRPCEEVTVF